MTPDMILARLTEAGITVTLTPDGTALAYESPRRLTEDQRAYLRHYKPALLEFLRQAGDPPPLDPDTREAIDEAIDERAAIHEHDADEPRPVAESNARGAMRVYDLLVAMGPDQPPKWTTLLAPGCDLAEARRSAAGRFGADRLLQIKLHINEE